MDGLTAELLLPTSNQYPSTPNKSETPRADPRYKAEIPPMSGRKNLTVWLSTEDSRTSKP